MGPSNVLYIEHILIVSRVLQRYILIRGQTWTTDKVTVEPLERNPMVYLQDNRKSMLITFITLEQVLQLNSAALLPHIKSITDLRQTNTRHSL